MDNFYVLLGLNPTSRYDENTVDDRIRQLTETRLAALGKQRTVIRQMFADRFCREEMRKAFSKEGALFTAEYRKEDHKLCIRSGLPSCYGEFTVLTSGRRFEAGAYDRSLMDKCTETGETEIGEDDMPVSVLTPAFSEKYYYPVVKMSVGGTNLYYIIGREENRAFVRITGTEISYETVTACFDDGVFLPVRFENILKSVGADKEKGMAVGIRRGRTNLRIGFVEKTDTGEYLLLKETEI